MTKKVGQVAQLKAKLNDVDPASKQQAIRRIIDAMTRGKDVSMLFMDVIKNMETSSLQLKKLIYLYVMSYAKTHPDQALAGINTFRKDAVDKANPFLRALAVRTMGCIRINEITEYLCDPLKKALRDEDPYVRKTGALCVPKLYEISPTLIQEQGFLKLLQNLLNDGNATVVSNAVASLAICSQLKGEPLIVLTSTLVQKLLTAMNDCNQWGAVYVLDTLSSYIPSDPQETENIMQRVSSRLAHTNSAVSLSAIRLIIKYMDYLSNPESIRTYNNKISSPLISMITRDESEISYLVLKTINLVLQKRPLLLPKELEVFFVNYHDPLYVKMEKLEVLSKIANNQNILLILHHLKECVQQVDVEFVRKAVRTMGRCAIKLEKMADKCVQCLWETLKTKVPYVVQQSVIVIRDIFRKYPKKYEGLLSDICENLKSLDDPEAKASIVWIIGEYVQMIENADELLNNFAQNFKDEPDVVQHQILVSCMKLYLHRPSDGQQILKDLFKYITKECENPDLRDRGYIYWRLLSTNPKLAKSIVLKQRPLISDQSYTLETELLQNLIQNIGYLSSVYCKQPQDFVKKLKDNANARQVIEQDPEQLLAKNQNEVVEEVDQNRQVSFANQQIQALNIPSQLIEQPPMQQISPPIQQMQTTQPIPIKKPQVDLLGIQQTVVQQVIQQQQPIIPQPIIPQQVVIKQEKNLLDDDETMTSSQTISQPQVVSSSMIYQQNNLLEQEQTQTTLPTTTLNPPGIFNFFDTNKPQQPIYQNVFIPVVEVLSGNQTSREGKYHGLTIRGAFERQGPNAYLVLDLQNNSGITLTDFALRLNANAFKLNYPQVDISEIQQLNNGQTRQVKLLLSTDNNIGQLQGWPYSIDCALRVIDDAFIFKVPLCFSVVMLPNYQITIEEYKQILTDEANIKKQESLQNSNDLEQFITKLNNNNLSQVFRKQNAGNELMSYGCILMNGIRLIVQIIFDKSSNAVNIQMTGPSQTILAYFNHALNIIVNL